jgi:hypothetical protein
LPEDHPALPRIYIDSHDAIFVLWWSNDSDAEGGSGNYVVSRSTDGGETFRSKILAKGYWSSAEAITSMALAETVGKLIVAWVESGRAKFVTSNDGGQRWTDAKAFSADSTLINLIDLVTDSSGQVHAFTVQSAQNGIQLTHWVSDGETWRQADQLPFIKDASTGDMSEVRALISERNRLNVVYSLVDSQSGRAQRLRVWYSMRMLGTPGIAPAPVPTVAQTTRPTLTPQPTGTASPLNTRTAIPTTVRGATESEQPANVQSATLYAIGLPVLMVCGLLILVVLFRAQSR